MSAWELLAEYTDSRYVSFELDVLWATDAGVDVVQMLQERAIPTDDVGGVADRLVAHPGCGAPPRNSTFARASPLAPQYVKGQ
ncbi:hypothetical protein CQ010_00305 [Arthrobacter sp. MYb211]|uniref:hypothetical protein n=1 Tax=unclassified Arthrobacter TaxID=235627 RepID=UPI000CFB6EED|nr:MULTISPECIES: hypothetical protein [unclassified Arthrobacter]PQZ96555.1 hypothetical protein CQ017_17150 [Arthrobacter sp. MYb224]PRA13130.1 hypothetical protein CQ015_02560 [Arthrobacter sp. MYb221]PRC10323.1 hypothetical protein CQ010_00305 [Arthrobacter sp. MYb211]